MNPETRRVTVFVVVGLSAAVLIAFLFWRAGSPSPAPVAQSAPATEATDTRSSGTVRESASEVSPSLAPATDASSDSREFVAPAENDPFLAPNAVAQVPGGVAPSSVYRPRNVGEQPRLHQDEPTVLTPSQSPAPSSSGTEPSPSGSSAPETTPQSPATPSPTQTPTPQLPTLPDLPGTPSVPTQIPLPTQIPVPSEQAPVEPAPANPAPEEELHVPQPAGSGFWPTFPWWR